jgi:1-acyl-sn-glycerol-3-phosphate acyltransferase
MNVWVKKQSVFKTKETFKNATLLAQKTSQHIIIFPEGRRYSDGQIHQFYNGFFNLAEQLNRPVLPIAIHGLYKILPKKSFLIDSNACLVKISIGKIMYISDYKTKQDFIETAQNWFKQQLNDLEKK